ncbi:MAG: hypothetical protein H6711_05580 [Myxococcales bacterium]|nr:hypothetical protein [Myxococcales bacterium]
MALDRAAQTASEPADPVAAVVSPIDEGVLAQVALALDRRHRGDVPYPDRVRANALLARIHNEALLQLGPAAGAPAPPLVRVLAGRFLHFGRAFVGAQRRRSVAGLDPLAADLERRLLAVMEVIEATPYAADDALLFHERAQVRRHLLGAGARKRLREAGGRDPAEVLPPWSDEMVRLIDAGFVDQAIDLGAGGVREAGVAPIEEALLAAFAAAQRDDGRRRSVERMGALREQEPTPPIVGESPVPTPRGRPWPPAPTIAERLEASLTGDGPRPAAVAAAILTLRERPDAALALIRRILPDDPASTESGRSLLIRELPWLLAEVEARDLVTRARLRASVAAARLRPPQEPAARERALRRRFALAAEEARGQSDAIATEQLLANRPRSLAAELEGPIAADEAGESEAGEGSAPTDEGAEP